MLYVLFCNSCTTTPSIIKSSYPDEIVDSNSDNKASKNKIKILVDKQNQKIIELESQIAELNKSIDKQNIIMNEISKEISDNNSKKIFNSELKNSIIKIKNKVKILEDKAFYSDSLYFELINEIVRVENSIQNLSGDYKINNNEELTNEEYTSLYINYLSLYQKGDLENSMAGFNELIQINNYHDLSDNCQYWIGEIYYSEKKYESASKEFIKVFNFQGTNKADDAYYKLGLSYLKMNNNEKAIEFFNNLLEKFPNSEYVKRTKEQINYISKG